MDLVMKFPIYKDFLAVAVNHCQEKWENANENDSETSKTTESPFKYQALIEQALPKGFTTVLTQSWKNQFFAGDWKPVDSAAFLHVPSILLAKENVSKDEILSDCLDNTAEVVSIFEMDHGRIAFIVVPWLDSELFTGRAGYVKSVVRSMHLAKSLGARCISLAGMNSSATHYGELPLQLLEEQQVDASSLPMLSTGHAVSTSCAVMMVEKLARCANRDLTKEDVVYVGLGSVGSTTLLLMLTVLPHPKTLILVDVQAKKQHLDDLKIQLVQEYGFKGDITIELVTGPVVPEGTYAGTLFVGATSQPDVVEVDKLPAGALIVDDSHPHCFNMDQALERMESVGDIFFTEAGKLLADSQMHDYQIVPDLDATGNKRHIMQFTYMQEYIKTVAMNPNERWGCIFSSLLSAKFPDDFPPTTGIVDVHTAEHVYRNLEKHGLVASEFQCEKHYFGEQEMARFLATTTNTQLS
eukprot:TRINITY_DN2640_c0_g1_i2.p1 TRINITY_DN2640_c0_g1~~TRINITY_DN2640_c0_g1_i2.p1  ORF type:complete len:468 (+),score=152.50 TRINITY_DN2640_c0_g1_i2:1266-2669(+)